MGHLGEGEGQGCGWRKLWVITHLQGQTDAELEVAIKEGQ